MEANSEKSSSNKDEAVIKETTATSKTADVKNRGWPKGKKRYPKSPGAPKQPLSGYVHFLNDRREAVRKEAPDMSFADISKKLANEWSHLGPEEKTKYAERAELDKERYGREFQEYQLTDSYKEFMIQQQKEAAQKAIGGEPIATPPSKKSKKAKANKKDDNSTNTTTTVAINEDSRSSSSLDIPIFREEFIELNKAREAEMRHLRKQATEFEEQNAVLQKHVDNMRSAVSKLERDTTLTKDNNEALEKQLENMKKLVMKNFDGIQVSGLGTVTGDNFQEFIAKIHEKVTKEKNDPALIELVKKATASMDLSSLISSNA